MSTGRRSARARSLEISSGSIGSPAKSQMTVRSLNSSEKQSPLSIAQTSSVVSRQ